MTKYAKSKASSRSTPSNGNTTLAHLLGRLWSRAVSLRQASHAADASGVVLAVIDTKHILLVDHKNARLWLPTGGHVEAGEHPRNTVVRELQDELGFESSHPIEPMVTCVKMSGLAVGHIDVCLWYVIHAVERRHSKYKVHRPGTSLKFCPLNKV